MKIDKVEAENFFMAPPLSQRAATLAPHGHDFSARDLSPPPISKKCVL